MRKVSSLLAGVACLTLAATVATQAAPIVTSRSNIKHPSVAASAPGASAPSGGASTKTAPSGQPGAGPAGISDQGTIGGLISYQAVGKPTGGGQAGACANGKQIPGDSAACAGRKIQDKEGIPPEQ